MEIGTKKVVDTGRPSFNKKVNELLPSELREAVRLGEVAPEWMNQQNGDEGFTFPLISHRHGNFGRCENETDPDKDLPMELFNFDLILNSRKFQVCLDTLIRIKNSEDLALFSDIQLKQALELCASYRITCFCAHIAAHKEYRNWKTFNELWMAEKREEARKHLKADRISEKAEGLRKEIGQISAQELEDYILKKHASEYRSNRQREEDWEENAKVYMELRDTLKDRGMHLQTLLKGVNDNRDPNMTSSGAQR